MLLLIIAYPLDQEQQMLAAFVCGIKALELNASGWMLPDPEDKQKIGSSSTVCTVVAYLPT